MTRFNRFIKEQEQLHEEKVRKDLEAETRLDKIAARVIITGAIGMWVMVGIAILGALL